MFRPLPDGIELRVKAQPKARRPGVGGVSPDGAALRVAVSAPAEDGRANAAVIAAVAAALAVPASAVALAHGATGRLKTLRILGDPAGLSEKLKRLLA